MFNILQNANFDNVVRIDAPVKVTDPVTIIKTGACCRLYADKEAVRTGYAINFITGTKAEPYAPGTGASDKLSVKVDGGAAQTITLAGTDTTAALVAAKINTALTGAVASATADNKVKIVSGNTRGSIEIVAITNDAYTVLGLAAGKSNDTKTSVFFAFTSANDPNEDRGDYRLTGKITLLRGVLYAETDQFDTNESYAVGDKLTSENGILIPAGANDSVCARVIQPPVDGVLQILTLGVPAEAV